MIAFDFKKWNIITGWAVFAVALCTYWLTVEPTTSFWDASEYITTSSNLEVGHPPGAPLYQILGAFFSIFAFGEVTKIALMVNLMSVFASAFTILFMFWSLTILLRKIISGTETIDTHKAVVILGSAAVGALAFTFSDSFWFSAVEAEVYAMASFLIAVLFYLGLLWERDMHEPRGNKWLILIAFLIGLSFGVHFMALLTIPAIGLLYYFKNTQTITIKNFIIANIAVVGVLLFIFMFLLPMTMRFFSASELFFINTMGLPFHSGTIIAGLVMIGLFYFLLNFTRKKEYVLMHTGMLCILFVFIGFSSWIMLPVRANAGTTINQNNPRDAQELLSYYNREQYGESGLLFGASFTEIYAGLDPNNPYKDGKPNYERDDKTGKYIIVNNYKNSKQNLDDKHKGFFPRMTSTEDQHVQNYMEYTGPLDFNVKREYLDEDLLVNEVATFKRKYALGEVDNEDYHRFLKQFGDYLDVKPPTFTQNMHYMFDHQFTYMYFRYFMWNFAGKQNDLQGKWDPFNGNWLSGIKFVDEMRLGSQDNLPSDVKNNKGRNTYYMLPLLLGIMGLVFHFGKDKTTFWVLMVLFLFTGLALKVYLNERPFEPRERDYALVGSFYVFAMWIGFGVYALFDTITAYIKPKIAAPVAIAVALLAAPVLMASQNWDDHDRSEKYTAQAMGKKYLDSVDKNGIIFTIGDNDTFALWYAQSVEGYRTDVRVVNTSLFYADWYINDMKKKAYESDPIPSQLTREQYRGSYRDFIFHQPITKDTIPIQTWMNWVANEDERTTVELQSGQKVHTFPSKHIRIPVNKEAVLRNGIVAEKDAHLILPYIDIHIKGEVIYKNRLLMLDILANFDWERPIYFSGGSHSDEEYLWLKDYLQLDGIAYKLVPIKTPIDRRNPFDMGRIDSEKMYDIVMNWEWGNSGNPAIYHDPETRKNSISYRSNMTRLADQLIKEGEYEKAEEILDLGMEKMPIEHFSYYTLVEPFVSGYFQLDQNEKAMAIFDQLAQKYQENLLYYSGLTYSEQQRHFERIYLDIERYRSLVSTLLYSGDESLLRSRGDEFKNFLNLFSHFYGEEEEEEFDESELLRLLDGDSMNVENFEGFTEDAIDVEEEFN
jgi:hypothetical protein